MMCRVCQEDKTESAFAFKSKTRSLRQTICRSCSRIYSARHYRDNAETYKKRGAISAKALRERLRQQIYEYLVQHPCIDCGETDPVVLDFDHRDETQKLLAVSTLRRYGYSWNRIQAEIEKCDVRCANCHRRRTAR